MGGTQEGHVSSPLDARHAQRKARTPEEETGEGGARCQAKQGFCSSGTGVSPLDEQTRGRVSVPQTCTMGPGGSEVSLPVWLPGKLRYSAYLTPPPSSQQRRRREREKG